MAEPVLFNNGLVLVGGQDHTAQINEIALTIKNADSADARLGDTLDVKYPGLLDASLMIKGFWAAGTLAVDPTMFSGISGRTVTAITVVPPYSPSATPATEGNWGYTLRSALFDYDIGAKHGDLLPFSLSAKARSKTLLATTPLVDGNSIYRQRFSCYQTGGSGATGAIFLLGATLTTQKLVVTVHVAAASGTHAVLVESDSAVGFPSTTTVLNKTGLVAGSYVYEIAGAITDTYYRVSLTPSGSGTATAFVSIEPLS